MISYLATATIAASLMAVMPAAPEWEADYGKALKATRADDQPLLIVLEEPSKTENGVQQASHTTETLSPQETQSTEEAQLLASYQLCKVDVSTEYGKKVANAFGAASFPYTAIIDRSGSVIIFAQSGAMDAPEWSSMLTTYKNGDRSDAVLASTSAGSTSAVMFRKPYESSNSEPTCKSCQKGYCASCQKNDN